MNSIRYWNCALIGNQLHSMGDRPVWSDRLGLGLVEPDRHACPASPSAGPVAEGLPRKGGHPTLQGAVRAHRSIFEQSAQRLAQVVRFASYAAPELCRPRVGVRVAKAAIRRLLAFSRLKNPVGLWAVVRKRTPSGLRPAVGFSGAGAHALTRAPALPCCMGWRP